ncbi:MAG: hypothetical protein LH613_00540 [Chamaesiphon sp.]|nr:hypothetical protein [Chamaesiphon sp.]
MLIYPNAVWHGKQGSSTGSRTLAYFCVGVTFGRLLMVSPKPSPPHLDRSSPHHLE